jgi:nicotinic acid mononucleotide adenylyltransferase
MDRLLIFSGSFNPLHFGHKSMAEKSEQITGLKTNFEISIGNPDKPSLSAEEVEKRKQQFTNYRNVFITNNSLYKDKIKFFLGKAENLFFVMGTDTWSRLCVPKYDDVPELNRYFSEIGDRLNFIVFPRNGQIGENMIDKSLINSIVVISNFRSDISSTEIRKKDKFNEQL